MNKSQTSKKHPDPQFMNELFIPFTPKIEFKNRKILSLSGHLTAVHIIVSDRRTVKEGF